MSSEPVHVAITRRVREECVGEFEKKLVDFASRTIASPTSRGVHLIYPTPGSGSREYGILRSFASEEDRDAFYQSEVYRNWLESIQPMLEGEPVFRDLSGLEAWFRSGSGKMPPRWKMAFLTWLAVWPVSTLAGLAIGPMLAEWPRWPKGAVISAGVVVVLTWVAMPLLVKAAHAWLHPAPKPSKQP